MLSPDFEATRMSSSSVKNFQTCEQRLVNRNCVAFQSRSLTSSAAFVPADNSLLASSFSSRSLLVNSFHKLHRLHNLHSLPRLGRVPRVTRVPWLHRSYRPDRLHSLHRLCRPSLLRSFQTEQSPLCSYLFEKQAASFGNKC